MKRPFARLGHWRACARRSSRRNPGQTAPKETTAYPCQSAGAPMPPGAPICVGSKSLGKRAPDGSRSVAGQGRFCRLHAVEGARRGWLFPLVGEGGEVERFFGARLEIGPARRHDGARGTAAATMRALRLEPRSYGREGGKGTGPCGCRIATGRGSGGSGGSGAGASAAATTRIGWGSGPARVRSPAGRARRRRGGLWWRRGRLLRAAAGKEREDRLGLRGGHHHREPDSRSCRQAIRRCAGSPANTKSSDPSIGARPTYSTLTLAVPAPLKSRTSATREDTSITRPP